MTYTFSDTIVTTDRKIHTESLRQAQEIACRMGLDFVHRRKESIPELLRRYGAKDVLVVKKECLSLENEEGQLFFHPNMSQLRLKNIRIGEKDHLVEAMDLQEGMSVLDCTLGFGADSIVASFVVGEKGSVIGLESSPLIAAVTAYGLAHYMSNNYEMHAALRRIQVKNIDYLYYLYQQSDKSVDVIYFDPMFRHPLMDSASINPLRRVANPEPLSPMAIKEARRVARRRIVMKENSRSGEFQRLGFAKMVGGKYSKINYGVIEL